MSDEEPGKHDDVGHSALDKAAAQGPLPGLAEQDAEEERGEDGSEGSTQPKGSIFGDMFGSGG